MENTNTAAIWQIACDQLKQNMSVQTYQTWIEANPLTEFRLVGDDRAIGVITSPSEFYSATLEKNFYAQIKEVLDKVTGRNSELQFRVGTPTVVVAAEPAPVITVSEPKPQPLMPSVLNMQERLQKMAQEQKAKPSTPHPPIQKPQAESLFSQTNIQTMAVDRARANAQKAGLLPENTFDTFAVSTTNEMAHAAALAVSSQPGTAYNPLFIYGGVGVGKTHLMQAVGNNILRLNPETKILYCTGEDFTNEIVRAIQTKKTLFFKEKFRIAEVLLIDDVQFIAGKDMVQEEFFHTFNTIIKRSGQIIMTSDRPPQEIALLEDRLRSRFEAGLMVDIQAPAFELRTAILLIKAAALHITIPMPIAQEVAKRVVSARQIEGIMQKIKSSVELQHREITLELIDEFFREDAKPKEEKKTLRLKPYDVVRTVAEYYHVKIAAIRGSSRVQHLVRARHVAMYFVYGELHIPYMEVGHMFGNRDHTSVIHAFEKITAEVQIGGEVAQEVSHIYAELSKMSK